MATPPEHVPQDQQTPLNPLLPPGQLWWGNPSEYTGPLPPKRGTDGLAIGSFVVGLVPFFIPVSLGLGIAALVRKRSYQRRAKGFAIAGLVLSGVWMLVGLVGIFVVAAKHQDPPARPGQLSGPGVVRMATLKPGTCFDQGTDRGASAVRVVSCAQPHDGQMLKVSNTLAGGNYPGATTAESTAAHTCATAEYDLMPDADSILPDDVVLAFDYPTQDSWWQGGQEIDCFLSGTGRQRTTGPVDEYPPAYNAQQSAFLKLEKPRLISEATYYPMADPSWTEGQPWAVQVATDERAEAAELVATKWPASVAPRAKALAAAELKDAKLWDAVVTADDKSGWSAATDRITKDAAGFWEADQAMREALQLP